MRMFGFDRFGGPEVQGFFDVEDPVVGPRQVLISLVAAGVNPADVKVRSGLRAGTVPVDFPMAIGREACGRVVACGEGMEFAEGDLVFGSCATGAGALAELVLLDGPSVTPVPEGVDPAAAACVPVALATAFDAVHELGLGAGETLLVVGVGGVGEPALQLATARGARGLGVGSPVKRAIVQEAGGIHVMSGDGWAERVRAMAPEGVDAVLDCVGGEVLREAATLLRTPGRLRSVADFAGAAELGGSAVTRRRVREVYAEVVGLVAEGVLRPRITVRVPFDRAADAVAAVETDHLTGKAVVAMPEAVIPPGPFFHGTRAELATGDLLETGRTSNYGSRRQANHLYFAGSMDAAIWGAELASGDGAERIYRVEPTGSFEDDPNLTNAKFPGNPTQSYRTREPLRILDEVTGWTPHDPVLVRTMRDNLERLKEQGVEAID